VLSSGAGVILIAGGLSELQFICQLNEKITLGKTRIQADKLLGTRATAGTQLGRKRSST
jgi:hypothetical protein